MTVSAILGHWALSSTIQTGVIVGVVLLVTRLAWRHLSSRWIAALWILVPIRLVVPGSPAGWFPVSTVNAASQFHIESRLLSRSVVTNLLAGASVKRGTPLLPHGTFIHWPVVAILIWSVGVLGLALKVLSRELRFRKATSKARQCTDLAELISIPNLDIRETPAVMAPAAFGLWRPQILIPSGLRHRLTIGQWQWVVQHEWNHIRHLDIAVRWTMEIVAVVYWFNPFVWVARHEVRVAQEFAADDDVIQHLPLLDRLDYGRLLLTVATYHERVTIPSIAGMKIQRSSLARRIERIRQRPHRAMAFTTTAVAVTLTLVLALSVAVVAAPNRFPMRIPEFPPGLGTPPQSQAASLPAGSTPGTIRATTFAQAVRISLVHQIHGGAPEANVADELARLSIASILTIHHTHAVEFLLPFQGHLFMGELVAAQNGTRWSFAFPSHTSLGFINPKLPLNVMETGGQITPGSVPFFFIAGVVTRPNIQYVIIHFTSGAVARVNVLPSRTFTYLTTTFQGTSEIDAYSAGHHLVYRW